jgi:uncharacterized protein
MLWARRIDIMTEFTPIASTLGGILIGLSAAGLLLFNGKIAGISGISGGLLDPPERGDRGWRLAFVAGLVSAGLFGGLLAPNAFVFELSRSTPAVLAAGLLVGLGTRIGSGCTSGHGVCGIGRLSRRSIAATLTFVATGAATVLVIGRLFGGSI